MNCAICDDVFDGSVCKQCRADAALGRAVRKEIAELEHKRDNDCILSDMEDEWLNDLQTLVAEAGLMKGEK